MGGQSGLAIDPTFFNRVKILAKDFLVYTTSQNGLVSSQSMTWGFALEDLLQMSGEKLSLVASLKQLGETLQLKRR